jgi:hypothetical protein
MKKKETIQENANYLPWKIFHTVKIMALLMVLGISQLNAIAQQLAISGTVTESETGLALPGVNIVVKGTNTGAMSDENGRYSLSLSEQNATIVFSFIGYVTQEVQVAGKSVINVALTSDALILEEVVVVGYGTQKKATVTGAVSSVQSETITRTPTVTTSGALVGKCRGLMHGNMMEDLVELRIFKFVIWVVLCMSLMVLHQI